MFELPKTVEECQAAEREVLALLDSIGSDVKLLVKSNNNNYCVYEVHGKDEAHTSVVTDDVGPEYASFFAAAPALAYAYIALLRSHAELLAREAESDALIEELKERV